MRVRSERREETNDGREVYADHRPTIRRKMSGKLNSPSGNFRLAVHVAHGDAERRVVREPQVHVKYEESRADRFQLQVHVRPVQVHVRLVCDVR